MKLSDFRRWSPFCRFEWRFRSSLPSQSYILDLTRWLDSRGQHYVQEGPEDCVFSIAGAELLGPLAPGMASVSVQRDKGSGDFEFKISFTGLKRLNSCFSAAYGTIIVLGAIGKGDASVLLALPTVVAIGYCHFYGMLPAKVARIRRRLVLEIPPPGPCS